MDNFDFLPDTIKGNLRTAIYGLILFHIFIFTVWILLTIPSLFKPSTSFSSQIDDMIKKNKTKHE
ncbi:transmembrane protein, putative (macronuclear) [Tetrahymena thermophila SB210]|uniref:Transmembrane protein, putative n=1 Tax=Tetrahymena thermophila (strain SB210) TaxID=312017 RepID=Q22KQ9_TETTS|nr:transmembrane protein, putative [Tetrahymena thermophila SB210]EAR85740.1 transmembrane protein, putative [Tetrahymena thermophila SB210]|eukprot:XP_001033403.1 transmembrane protein, putative [Tetrahymena thermophila SB210]